jgi:hypothetical protein
MKNHLSEMNIFSRPRKTTQKPENETKQKLDGKFEINLKKLTR